MGSRKEKSASGRKRRRAGAEHDEQGRVWTPRIPVVWLSMLLTATAFLGLMGGGIAVLHMRANAEAPPVANPPVTVDAPVVRLESGYAVTERFAGRLEPARETDLAFERAGLIVDILFEEGDRVEAGATVARMDTAKLEAERARLAAQRRELEARRDLAEVTLTRQKALQTKGWQSAQRYDEARFALAEITAGMARLDAAIASVDVDLRKSVLIAPYSGTVAARSVDQGAVVAAGTSVVELLEADAKQVRIGVSVASADALTAGEVYELQAGGRTFEGRLISKRPDLQTGTRTVTTLFGVNGAATVPFGDIVELRLTKQIDEKGAWIPIRALTEGRKGLWSVLTVTERDGNRVAAREAVEVLHLDGGRAYVRGTIADGARIVVSGVNRVIAGQQVALAPAE